MSRFWYKKTYTSKLFTEERIEYIPDLTWYIYSFIKETKIKIYTTSYSKMSTILMIINRFIYNRWNMVSREIHEARFILFRSRRLDVRATS